MKEAEEIVKYLDLEFDSEINRKYYSNIIASAIKQAQVDAWNEALDKAAESAEIEDERILYGEIISSMRVSPESILKLKL